jgi:hypothetical protein
MPTIAKRRSPRRAKPAPRTLKLSAHSSTEAVPAERRRGLRIRQSRPIKVFEPLTARYLGGQTQDVSSTGLRIELPASAPVSSGSVLSIHVGIDSRGQGLANRRAMIPARIIWVDRRIQDGRGTLTAGVEFVASIAAHLDAA